MGFFGLGCFVVCTPTMQKAALYNMPPALQMKNTNENDSSNTDSTMRYSPPKHSKEFLRHLESVKSSWPYNDVADKEDEDVADQTKDNVVLSNSEYGVYCTGEPSIDPSRMLQGISEDDQDWI